MPSSPKHLATAACQLGFTTSAPAPSSLAHESSVSAWPTIYGSPDYPAGSDRPASTGLWRSRLSMARAMSSSGEVNPNVMRMLSVTFVFID